MQLQLKNGKSLNLRNRWYWFFLWLLQTTFSTLLFIAADSVVGDISIGTAIPLNFATFLVMVGLGPHIVRLLPKMTHEQTRTSEH